MFLPLSSFDFMHQRPPSFFDVVLMFKILILKNLHNLSDEETERQIRDRLSFRDFLGLAFSDTVPDAKTIWLYKPLSAEQQKMNKMKSKVRCRVDGAMRVRCRDEVLRSIGLERAAFWIGMRNLVHNFSRFVSLRCPKPVR